MRFITFTSSSLTLSTGHSFESKEDANFSPLRASGRDTRQYLLDNNQKQADAP